MTSYEHWPPQRWAAEARQKKVREIERELDDLVWRYEQGLVTPQVFHREAKILSQMIIEVEKGESK